MTLVAKSFITTPLIPTSTCQKLITYPSKTATFDLKYRPDLVAIPDKYYHPSLARSEFVYIQFFSPFLAQTQVECQFSHISTVLRYIGSALVAILDKYYHPSSAQFFSPFFSLDSSTLSVFTYLYQSTIDGETV